MQLLIFVLIIAFGAGSIASAEAVQVGRYAVLTPTAPMPQQFPLLAVQSYALPVSVNTVGEAIQFVLAGTGYALAASKYRDPRVESMLAARLPNVQRRLGPVRVDHALRALAGPGFELVVDPIHRLVAFDLSTRYLEESGKRSVLGSQPSAQPAKGWSP